MMETCPICCCKQVTKLPNMGGYDSYDCCNCGKYALAAFAYRALTADRDSLHGRDRQYMQRCAAVMLERNLKGLNEGVVIDYDPDKMLYFLANDVSLDEYYPKSALDRLERAFFNIIRDLTPSPFVDFTEQSFKHHVPSLLFSVDGFERPREMFSMMVSAGWLTKVSKNDDVFLVTMKGLERFEEQAEIKSSNAFLAMWFGVKGSDVYRDAVSKAVESAGYHLQVVDKENYNGFIMDKVVNLINDSAFVIADISASSEIAEGDEIKNGVRGGVYWEAGYASGQRKQVILTCNNDDESKKRIHFDLQQYNQIRWDVIDGKLMVGEQDFEDVLKQRILATVGKGSAAH